MSVRLPILLVGGRASLLAAHGLGTPLQRKESHLRPDLALLRVRQDSSSRRLSGWVSGKTGDRRIWPERPTPCYANRRGEPIPTLMPTVLALQQLGRQAALAAGALDAPEV